MVNICLSFFEKELNTNLDIIKTDDGFDINYKKYELGSYGIRSCEYLSWIYGTGLAEPRMTIIKNLINGVS